VKGYLLDTNVPSEYKRLRPDPRVVSWVDSQPRSNLYVSVITLGEIRKGLILMDQGVRRRTLESWLATEVHAWFENRTLPITEAVADRWGVIDAESQVRGNPLNTADGLIAATALVHELTVVTRNVKDFAGLGVEIYDPWNSQGT
jgi:predicted nucleic acid-binding protein